MATGSTDPLLRVSRLVIWIFCAVFALSFALLLLALGAYIVWQTGLLGSGSTSASSLSWELAPRVPFALLLAAAITALAFRFIQLLGRIVDSLKTGDPFSQANADRLRHMAMLALIYQVLSWALFALGITVARFRPIEALVSGDEISLTGLLVALVLFILARVFRHGAAMCEDLEGTV